MARAAGSACFQKPPESVNSFGILVTVEPRQATAHIVLGPLSGEIAPFSEGDDAARLQVAKQRIYRDDEVVAGDVIVGGQRALPQCLELNVRSCQRPPAVK